MATPTFQPWLGLFETIRVVAGRPLFMAEHWAALSASAQALGLPLPADLRERAADLPDATGRWRWIVDAEGARDLFVSEEDTTPATYRLVVAPQRVGAENWDARHKTFSHLTHVQARRAAKEAGSDEAVLLNERNELASGAMTNLFWVKGGVLFTPAVEAGCRAGIVRGWVLSRHTVQEAREPLDALRQAEEIFVTNSMIGIRPVTRFEDRTLAVGPVTSALRLDYDKLTFT